MGRFKDRTTNPYYNELRMLKPMGKEISDVMILKSHNAQAQTIEILGIMDNYCIEYYIRYKGHLRNRLTHNDNLLTIDMLNEITVSNIDSQVGRIIIDHINSGIYNTHSYSGSEWKVME